MGYESKIRIFRLIRYTRLGQELVLYVPYTFVKSNFSRIFEKIRVPPKTVELLCYDASECGPNHRAGKGELREAAGEQVDVADVSETKKNRIIRGKLKKSKDKIA